MDRHQPSATWTHMPCKQVLGRQMGWVPTVWSGCAEAHQNLTAECEMECYAGGTCLYLWVWGNTSKTAELSSFVASTPLQDCASVSVLCSFCVLTVPLLSFPSPLQKQPSSYSVWLLTREVAKFNLSVQLIQLISKIQQIRELALQSSSQSTLLNGVPSVKGTFRCYFHARILLIRKKLLRVLLNWNLI